LVYEGCGRTIMMLHAINIGLAELSLQGADVKAFRGTDSYVSVCEVDVTMTPIF
jgi:hypothetical protein